MALGEDADQDVLGLALGAAAGASLAAYMRWSASRSASVAVTASSGSPRRRRRRDVEALALLAQRGLCGALQLVGVGGVGEHAELVASEPVGGARAGATARLQAPAEALEQRVAGEVTEVSL